MLRQWLGIAILLCGALAGGSVRGDQIVLVAGGGAGADGVPAIQAKLHGPFGVDFDSKGNLFICELSGGHIHKIDAQGVFSTLAGTGKKGDAGDGGPAAMATFNGMHNLAIGPGGDLFVADTWNNRIRRIDARTGIITAFAGTGKKKYSGDGGPAATAESGGIYSIAFDTDFHRLYLVDLDHRRIRVIDMKSGKIELVAGNGMRGVPTEGEEAKSSPLVDPRAVAVDRAGNVYILERSGHALRDVDPHGKIHTVAGTGKAGVTGEGGPALQATFNGPKHLCIDHDQSVLIADTENHVVRRYLPREKKVVPVAGSGKKGIAGLDGPPEKCELHQPHGVFVHRDGTLYIVDSGNDRILKIIRE